jgi:hypothetical protein
MERLFMSGESLTAVIVPGSAAIPQGAKPVRISMHAQHATQVLTKNVMMFMSSQLFSVFVTAVGAITAMD